MVWTVALDGGAISGDSAPVIDAHLRITSGHAEIVTICWIAVDAVQCDFPVIFPHSQYPEKKILSINCKQH